MPSEAHRPLRVDHAHRTVEETDLLVAAGLQSSAPWSHGRTHMVVAVLRAGHGVEVEVDAQAVLGDQMDILMSCAPCEPSE